MASQDPFLRGGKSTQAEGPEGEGSQDDGQEVTKDQEISPDRDLGRPRGRGDTDGIGEDVITNDFEDLLTRNELLCVPDPHLVPKSIKATSLDRALAYLDSASGNSGPTGNYALQRFIQSPTIPSAHLADPFSPNTASTDEEMDRPSDSSFSELPEIIQSYSQPTYGINGQIVHLGNFNYLAKHNPVSPSLPSMSQLQLGNPQQQQLEASSMGRATQSLPGRLELELIGPGYESKSERESVTTGVGSSLDRLRALRQRSTNPSTNRSVSKESREREEDELLNDDLELLDFDLPITTSPKEVEWPIEDIINYNTSWLVDNISGTSSARVNITPMQNRQFTPERSLLLDHPQNIIAPEGTAQNSGQEIPSMPFSSSFLVAPPDSYSASRPRELSQFTPPPPSGMVYYSLEELPRAPHINQYGPFPPPGVLHSRGIPTPISQSTFGVQHPYGVQTPAPQSSFTAGIQHPYDSKAPGVLSLPGMIGGPPLAPLPQPPQPQPGPSPGLMGYIHGLSPRSLVPFSTELRLLPGVPIPSIQPSTTKNQIARKNEKAPRIPFQIQQSSSTKISPDLSEVPIVPSIIPRTSISARHLAPSIPPSLPREPILPSEPLSMIDRVASSLPAYQPPFPLSGGYPRGWVPGARPRGDAQWQFSDPIIHGNRPLPPGLRPHPQGIGQIIEIPNGQPGDLNESRTPLQYILPYLGPVPRLLEIQNTQSIGDNSPSNFQPLVNIAPAVRPPPGLVLPRPGTGSPFLSLDPLLAHPQEIPLRPVEASLNSPENTESPNHGIIDNYQHPDLHERGGVLMELHLQREGVTQRSTRNSLNRRTQSETELWEQTDRLLRE